MEITQEERKKLLKMAYENGYSYFEYLTVDIENMEHLSMLVGDSYGKNSLSQTYWDIEDHFNFERGKHDWDNYGIYGIIEDSNVCYEAGAKDGIENNEYNPDRVSHMWE